MGLADVLNDAALVLGVAGVVAVRLTSGRFTRRGVLDGFAFGYTAVYASALVYLIVARSPSLLPVIDQSRVPIVVLCILAFVSALSDFVERMSGPR
jgi:hypothetical protein